MGSGSYKLTDKALLAVKEIQHEAEKQLADKNNIKKIDEIFPIWANNSAVITVSLLEFLQKWNKSKSKAKRREQIIKLINNARSKNFIDGDVRGYFTK